METQVPPLSEPLALQATRFRLIGLCRSNLNVWQHEPLGRTLIFISKTVRRANIIRRTISMVVTALMLITLGRTSSSGFATAATASNCPFCAAVALTFSEQTVVESCQRLFDIEFYPTYRKLYQ